MYNLRDKLKMKSRKCLLGMHSVEIIIIGIWLLLSGIKIFQLHYFIRVTNYQSWYFNKIVIDMCCLVNEMIDFSFLSYLRVAFPN